MNDSGPGQPDTCAMAAGAALAVQSRPGAANAATVWLTGLSGAGKSTLARALVGLLRHARHACLLLDGDEVRSGLSNDLGFSPRDRRENIRRVAEVARLANEAGVFVVAALISPLQEDRRLARQVVGPQRYIEVHVSTRLEVCMARDPKGLYARARSGVIPEFTGVSSPYEPPRRPQLSIDTEAQDASHGALRIHAYLQALGLLQR